MSDASARAHTFETRKEYTMTTTGTTQEGKAKAAGTNEIRPFTVSVPEAELAELRQRITATRYPERETVADAPRACSSRRSRSSRAIGRPTTTGASARRS